MEFFAKSDRAEVVTYCHFDNHQLSSMRNFIQTIAQIFHQHQRQSKALALYLISAEACKHVKYALKQN